MEDLKQQYIKTGSLHHAYFVVDRSKNIRQDFLKFFHEELGISIFNNPDLHILCFDTMTISDARELNRLAMMKTFVPLTRKIFIIEANSITEEAQNSLLKLFEEPIASVHFFLIMPQKNILPTLYSRFFDLSLNWEKVATKENFQKSFLKMSLLEKMKTVQKLSEEISSDKKTKQDAIFFVNQIEEELLAEIGLTQLYEFRGGNRFRRGSVSRYDDEHKPVWSKEIRQVRMSYENLNKNVPTLKVCAFAREVLLDRGVPVKMVLENLVLSI